MNTILIVIGSDRIVYGPARKWIQAKGPVSAWTILAEPMLLRKQSAKRIFPGVLVILQNGCPLGKLRVKLLYCFVQALTEVSFNIKKETH